MSHVVIIRRLHTCTNSLPSSVQLASHALITTLLLCVLGFRCSLACVHTSHAAGKPAISAPNAEMLVVFSENLSVRSYNSLSLPKDGRYHLTLTDCHGYIPGGGITDSITAATTTTRSGAREEFGGQEDFAGERGTLLSFLAVPFSLTFDVDSQVRMYIMYTKCLTHPRGGCHDGSTILTRKEERRG